MALAFTRMVQVATADISRRGLLKSAIAPALAGLGVTALLDLDEADARRRRRRRKGKKGKKGKRRKKGRKDRCLKNGSPCTSDQECCTKKGLICEVPVNGSNSDTYCCGGEGATCGGNNEDGDDLAPYCCVGFRCNSDTESPGVCVRVPDEL